MKNILLLIASFFVIASLAGCEKTTGDKVDDAIDSTKEASKDALDKMKKVIGD